MQYKSLIASLLVSTTSAQVLKGFNYGATLQNGACRDEAGFRGLFNRANSLQGTSGFSAARLYTTVQCGTTNDPSSAIQAAIDTDTSLLLGMWASAGSDSFNNEITALTKAIQAYPNLADRVVGISVGSEDLYRASPQGVANSAGVGADASAVTDYIGRVRRAISGTSLSGKPVGHVDTWTAWVLPENAAVAQAVDFLGHNSFPYFETTRSNSIDQATDNFNSALANTESVAGGKPVWVTETGWPHEGPASAQAVASTENAETYWKTVGCSLFGNRNTFWYTLEDANTAQTNIQFGVTEEGSGTPIYDLSCSNRPSTSSSSAVSSSSTNQGASSTATGGSSSANQSGSSSAAAGGSSSPSSDAGTDGTMSILPTDSIVPSSTGSGSDASATGPIPTLPTGPDGSAAPTGTSPTEGGSSPSSPAGSATPSVAPGAAHKASNPLAGQTGVGALALGAFALFML